MNYPPDRHGDNRWNQCLDALTEAWDRAGPDRTLAWITALARSSVTPGGVILVDVARDGGNAATGGEAA